MHLYFQVRSHSQVAEVLVEVQVFVVDGGEATLIGDVAVRGKHTCVTMCFSTDGG